MLTAAVLTVTEAAAVLDCSDDTVRERAADGSLPGVKFGRDWVFPAEAFYEAVNGIARAEAEERRSGRAPKAVSQPVGRPAPPALPTAVAPPGPRRGSKRSEAPSMSTSTP